MKAIPGIMPENIKECLNCLKNSLPSKKFKELSKLYEDNKEEMGEREALNYAIEKTTRVSH